MNTCKTCKWWVSDNPVLHRGTCHLNPPPHPMPIETDGCSHWATDNPLSRKLPPIELANLHKKR
jgi:hypothetical protein